ncbi:MAG TPA: A24 family peptidase [Clostridium sp.]|uniref:prepilin peptidase n=1 Tax=Clostridium sp. TaxID=1506 RepID=UPI002F93E417
MAILIFLAGMVDGFFLSIIMKKTSYIILNRENSETYINIMDFKKFKKSTNNKIINIIVILISGLLFLISFMKIGLNIIFIKALVLDSILIVVSFIDIEHQIIPNKLIIFILAVGVLFSFINDISFMSEIFGMLLGGGVLFLLALVPGSLGGGDIKLMFALGIFLGAKGILVALFLAFIIASIISILLLLFKIKKRKDYIPFGPFLALGSFIAFHFSNVF